MSGLDLIRVRLDWAEELTTTLHGKVGTWLNSYDQPVRVERSLDQLVDELYFNIPDDPPVWTSLIISDILHNLRSALDNLVYALAQRYTGKSKPPGASRLSFPITLDPNDFASIVSRIRRVIPPDALPVIEELQPYNASLAPIFPPDGFVITTGDHAERQSLNILRVWSNIDKHRTLHITHLNIIGSWGPVHGAFQATYGMWPVRPGTHLGTLTYSIPPPYDEMHVPLEFAPRVAINEPLEGYGAATDLGIIHHDIATKILPRFEVFFD